MRGQQAVKSLLKSCSVKGKSENVVVIDIDGDRLEDVIVIDAPESVEEDLQGSIGSKGGKNFPSPSVISIDDDDDDDEPDKMDDPEIRVESGGEMDSDASSRKSCHDPDFMQKYTGLDDDDDDDDDDCWFIRENKPAFKLSKCKKTYAGKTPCGKRFGLGPVFEDSSSESDWSDCELIEGSVGKLQEQWQKASRRKRYYNARNGQSGSEDQTSASGSRNDKLPRVSEIRSQQYAETPPSSGSGDSNIQKEKSSAFKTNRDGYLDDTCLDGGTESPVESEKKVDHERPTAEAQFSHVLTDVIFGREGFMEDLLSRDRNQIFSRAPSNCDPHPSDMQHGDTVANGKEKLQSKEPSMSIPKSSEEKQVDVKEQSILIDREKLKETDEYKRAMEEEWASRQRELKIQAEEAQRLRKKRKAEMRKVAMERRQKQRLEEMRETQKKDEENMNLKEQLRMGVRKELSKLEISCSDMASLLRSLGISVGGGFHPLSNEIHAAYKRALLRFHPDRASKTDIRQQVEAEEKFKLISRMKDKLLATSCQC